MTILVTGNLYKYVNARRVDRVSFSAQLCALVHSTWPLTFTSPTFTLKITKVKGSIFYDPCQVVQLCLNSKRTTSVNYFIGHPKECWMYLWWSSPHISAQRSHSMRNNWKSWLRLKEISCVKDLSSINEIQLESTECRSMALLEAGTYVQYAVTKQCLVNTS